MTTLLECCHRIAQTGTVLLLQSGVLLLLGLVCGWALRRRGPSAQSLAYRATLLAVLGAALLSALPTPHARPLWRVSLPTAQTVALVAMPLPPAPADTPAVPLPAPLPVRPATLAEATPPPTPAFAAPPFPVKPPAAPALARLYGAAIAVWVGGTCAALGWLGAGQVSLIALRRRSAPLTTGPAADVLRCLCDDRRLRSLPLLVSAHVHSPFLAGLWRPAVFLPPSYVDDLDGPALRAVLAHELAHRERRDNTWQLLARLVCAVLWVNPLVWVVSRRMEQAAEEACDALALESGCAPRAYADCLLHLAERLTPSRWEHTMGLGVVPFRSSVGRRIQCVLHSGRRTPLPQFVRVAIAAGAVLSVLLGSWLVSAADAPSKAADMVRQYLQACASGNLTQAYGLLSSKTREYVPNTRFTAIISHAPQYRFQPIPNASDSALDAIFELFEDPRQSIGYRFAVVGPAPDAPDVVLVRAFPPAGPDAQQGILLRIATTADPGSGGAPRLDLVGTAVPVKPEIAQKLEAWREQNKCVDNLRLIGLAMFEYVQDHHERFPNADHWVDAILPYVKDKSIFHDPSAPAGQQFSYAFNRNLSHATLAQLDAPAETTMVFESSKGVKNANDTGQSLPYPRRHTNGSDFLYADGHVKYLRRLPSFSLRGDPPTGTAGILPGTADRLGVVLRDAAQIRAGSERGGRILSVVPQGLGLAVSGETPNDYTVLMVDRSLGYIAKADVQLLPRRVDAVQPGETLGLRLVQTAYSYLGVPYVPGGRTRAGIDSGGLVQAVYAAHGMPLPSRPVQQAAVGYDVPHNVAAGEWRQWVAGDRLFFSDGGKEIDHTGLYIGRGLFIHASARHNSQVAIDRVNDAYYTAHLVAVRRSQELLTEIPEQTPPAAAQGRATSITMGKRARASMAWSVAIRAQIIALRQQRAVLQQQLGYAQQELARSEREVPTTPLHTMSQAPHRDTTVKSEKPSPAEASQAYAHAAHEHNEAIKRHWDDIQKWAEMVQQRQIKLAVVKAKIRALQQGR